MRTLKACFLSAACLWSASCFSRVTNRPLKPITQAQLDRINAGLRYWSASFAQFPGLGEDWQPLCQVTFTAQEQASIFETFDYRMQAGAAEELQKALQQLPPAPDLRRQVLIKAFTNPEECALRWRAGLGKTVSANIHPVQNGQPRLNPVVYSTTTIPFLTKVVHGQNLGNLRSWNTVAAVVQPLGFSYNILDGYNYSGGPYAWSGVQVTVAYFSL